jgi:hypothetical protein
MKQFEVELALQEIEAARKQWGDAHRDFDRTLNKIMARLLHEAAANRMSVEQVAKHSGIPMTRLRVMMRALGLDLQWSKGLLAESAAKALRENAELLSVDPLDMDLTSPLAYLPMGSDLRNKLQSDAVKGVKTCDCTDPNPSGSLSGGVEVCLTCGWDVV